MGSIQFFRANNLFGQFQMQMTFHMIVQVLDEHEILVALFASKTRRVTIELITQIICFIQFHVHLTCMNLDSDDTSCGHLAHVMEFFDYNISLRRAVSYVCPNGVELLRLAS